MSDRIIIEVPFEKYPFSGDQKRPILIGGTVQCELISIREDGPGDPVRVTWRVIRIDCIIGLLSTTARCVIDFDGDQKEIDYFCNWLKLRHGINISSRLREEYLSRQKEVTYE